MVAEVDLKQGQIWWVQPPEMPEPQPVLIVQSDAFNRSLLETAVCPQPIKKISTKKKRMLLPVSFPRKRESILGVLVDSRLRRNDRCGMSLKICEICEICG